MRFDYFSLTNAGPRSENQDAIGAKKIGLNGLVVAVADGLGGHSGGKLAADVAVEMFIDLAAEKSADLREIAERIHSRIKELQKANIENRSMATTLSAAIFRSGLMEFVHCGDTRIVVSRNAGIKKLTQDHTEAQRLLSSGTITKAEFENYPRKNILDSALGIHGKPNIEVGNFPIMLGDKFFFSSDGFHNKIYLRELRQFVASLREPSEMVKVLGSEMTHRNADDNYSLIAVAALP